MLGSPILYLKGMRILMFQLSGFYYKSIMCLEAPVSLGEVRIQDTSSIGSRA